MATVEMPKMAVPSYDCVESLLVASRVDDAAGKVLLETSKVGQHLSDRVCDSTSMVDQSVQRQGVAVKESVERNGLLGLQATERTSAETRLNLALSAGEIREHVIAQSIAQQRVTGEVTKQVCELQASLSRQIADVSGDIKLDACKNTREITKQAAEQFAAIQLEACKNKNDLARQLEECCCELKEKIDARAAETQGLIRSIEAQRVKDALAAATTENLILKMKK